ncbi:hypothetical protein F2P81_017770 [Scophthalmus maximus]|uniref:BPTI/Kunitz inhibitor domain-containing protein n=1 Tax=Scophthalmus maximus TaxID=52904 RepID=A0A6A4SET2_SCOMX|nr:hypothetical protein F2P81_017770 [Scophthalmus maximus]
MKVGLCRAAFPKFFYNVSDQQCHRFIYGGCDANANNFDSQEECESVCSGVTGSVLPVDSTPPPPPPVKAARMVPAFNTGPESEPAATESVPLQDTDQCTVTPDPGPCRAAFPKFYFDHNTGTCQSFLYGGCRGNHNRYGSMEECLTHCSRDASSSCNIRSFS